MDRGLKAKTSPRPADEEAEKICHRKLHQMRQQDPLYRAGEEEQALLLEQARASVGAGAAAAGI